MSGKKRKRGPFELRAHEERYSKASNLSEAWNHFLGDTLDREKPIRFKEVSDRDCRYRNDKNHVEMLKCRNIAAYYYFKFTLGGPHPDQWEEKNVIDKTLEHLQCTESWFREPIRQLLMKCHECLSKNGDIFELMQHHSGGNTDIISIDSPQAAIIMHTLETGISIQLWS